MAIDATKDCVMTKLNVKLAELMRQRNLARMDVVRGADLSYQTVSKWVKNDVKTLDPLTLAKLARYLEVEEHELYEITDEGE